MDGNALEGVYRTYLRAALVGPSLWDRVGLMERLRHRGGLRDALVLIRERSRAVMGRMGYSPKPFTSIPMVSAIGFAALASQVEVEKRAIASGKGFLADGSRIDHYARFLALAAKRTRQEVLDAFEMMATRAKRGCNYHLLIYVPMSKPKAEWRGKIVHDRIEEWMMANAPKHCRTFHVLTAQSDHDRANEIERLVTEALDMVNGNTEQETGGTT